MAKIRLSEPAQADLEGIFAYTVEKWGEQQAYDYLVKIDSAIRRAAENSAHSPPRRIGGRTFRLAHVGRHVVFFRDDEEGVLIVRVLHASRDLEAALRDDTP